VTRRGGGAPSSRKAEPKRLRLYAGKRRFDVTSEPPAETPRRPRHRALRFVVQKHRASHLHYDFRLEWDGVLLSWAVPKGPSLDPKVKRLAMAVEDHPIAYAGFEGIIPAGEYGGGTVMVWDRGTYQPEDPDVGAALRAGEIKFALQGEKLSGGWVLVRTRGRDSRSWLLLKRRDASARSGDVTKRAPRSVLSQRLMAEIAFDEKGDLATAASADPPEAIRALIRARRPGPARPAGTQPSGRARR
jgi:bifunctional non-homologous end joining protein LigD